MEWGTKTRAVDNPKAHNDKDALITTMETVKQEQGECCKLLKGVQATEMVKCLSYKSGASKMPTPAW